MGVNGLDLHLLEAGGGSLQQPLVVMLHGFPEIGYSWRKVMAPVAAAGFHVVAPDQRGYGRTTGWEPAPGVAMTHGVLDWVRDVLALVQALGYRQAHLVGHDFGSQIAATAALIRPEVFRSVALMSSPFVGAPALQTGTAAAPVLDVSRQLAALPRPRKHYQHYFASAAAVDDLLLAPQGLRAFLRAYFHVKSADWAGNNPRPMQTWSVEELARLPTYYVMDAGETMPQTVAHHAPSVARCAECTWMNEAELAVYVDAYERSGFAGALRFYRCRVDGSYSRDLSTFAGQRVTVPSCFISGTRDWGPHQKAGDLERMRSDAFSQMGPPAWIEHAGHWVQQEQPAETAARLLAFLHAT